MTTLPNIPVLVINLPRQEDRLRSIKEQIDMIGFKHVELVAAVDGDDLLAAGGRSRGLNKQGMHRVSYNEDNHRIVRMCRAGRNCALSYIWGQVGCTLSHLKALCRAKELLDGGASDKVLTLEDDAKIATEAADVKKSFKHIVQHLGERFPSWDLLLLGGAPCDAYCKVVPRHGPCGIAGLRRSESVYQTHACVVRASALEHICSKPQRGLMADSASVSYQRA